jgi:serine/threonine protein kinase/TolA-binding protein
MNDKSTFGAKPEQLKRLLTAIGLEESSVDEQKDETASSATPATSLIEQPGTRIGRYKLLRMLGEGGMGIVYLAEQQDSIRRRVALKVIKPGMDSKRVLARFEAERQALALLDHPNIAHVYDSGTTEAGRPFFAMEHVRGLPITEHCDRYKLTIKARLRLFQQVCQAVHHAHQKGIIHRDIKPSNILVSIHEDQAVPKIIDFGVAKAVSQPLTERTLYTEQGQWFGTPEYMSPEQVDMASEDIDTRSDIYSLGVLLYVLLTGVLPFDSETFRKSGIDQIRKVIREIDPNTPSTRLTKLGDKATSIAENRRMEIHTLKRHLRKELEWIPLKAMRKERTERYRSASELADDIDNYLNGAPLIAGPLTNRYRLRKYLRKHKALVGGIAAVLVVSIIGTIVSVNFALGQTAARAESDAVTDFLEKDVLGAIGTIRGRDTTVADALDVASTNLEGKFQDQPIVKARIHFTLGQAYRHLFNHKAAIPHWARAYQIYQEQYGENSAATIIVKNWLAFEYYGDGQYNRAEQLFDELIEGPNPEKIGLLLTWKGNLACVYVEQGRYEEAERFFLTSLETKTPWWEYWAPKGNPYLIHLADVYLYQGRNKEAEHLFSQFMVDHGDTALGHRIMYRLGYLYMTQERYEEAEDLFIKGIEYGNRELPGKDHSTTLSYMNGLAVLRTKQKQYEDAERLFNDVLEARKRKLGENHPHTLETKNDLAVLYKEQAQYEKAEPLLIDAVKGRRLKLSDIHPHTLESWHNLIELYEAWGKPEKANEWRGKLVQIEDFKE